MKGDGKDQAATRGSKRLAREDVISDINCLFDEIPAKRSKHSDQKEVPIDKM